MQKNVGATELIKDETKITLKTAIKAKKKVLRKMLKDFVGKKWNKTNVFQLCCVQRAYVGLV